MERVASNLRSVLTVSDDSLKSQPVAIFHASFRDFLTNGDRSQEFYHDLLSCHTALAGHCLQLMEDKLIRDGLNDESVGNRLVDPPSTALEYACSNWLSHLAELSCEQMCTFEATILDFFDHRVLRWIECVAMTGKLGDVIPQLRRMKGSQLVTSCN